MTYTKNQNDPDAQDAPYPDAETLYQMTCEQLEDSLEDVGGAFVDLANSIYPICSDIWHMKAAYLFAEWRQTCEDLAIKKYQEEYEDE